MQARHGTAGSVVVRGEPGVGKSALLDAMVAEAGESMVLRTRGLEVEAPLAFAALHRLLRPLTRLRDQLPPPQARALRVAFGEDDGPSVEPFLVGVATLSLLTAAAEEGLVLCVVDDAHWLDPASARTPCSSVPAGWGRTGWRWCSRPGTVPGRGSRRPGVDEVDARPVSTARPLAPSSPSGWGASRPRRSSRRLIAETRGNPLALLELPGELTAAQLAGAAALPTTLHLTARVEQAFLDRSRRLPEPVQRLLLLAAADDTGRLDVLRRACRAVGPRRGRPAGRVGLRTAGGRRHARSRCGTRWCARRSTRPPPVPIGGEHTVRWPRRWPGRAIGTARSGTVPTPPRGRTRSSSTPWRASAQRSQRRGGYVAALAAYERAAELSTDGARRARLAFAAARSAWACGQAARAQALLSAAREGTEDPILLCDVARLRGHIEVNIGSAPEAHRIFVEAAHAVLAGRPGPGAGDRCRRGGHAHLRCRQRDAPALGRPPRRDRRGRLRPHPAACDRCSWP